LVLEFVSVERRLARTSQPTQPLTAKVFTGRASHRSRAVRGHEDQPYQSATLASSCLDKGKGHECHTLPGVIEILPTTRATRAKPR
jgi:hypothetical protein